MSFNNSYTAVTGATYAASDYNTSTKGNLDAIWVGTTAGDIDYYSTATAKTRIGIGSEGSVLTVVSGVPAWRANNAYPVGCIYITTVSTNPATVFGFGTWTAFGAGRTLVGLDAGQTEFDVVEETGGAKTHTLTSAEMPAHTHTFPGEQLANQGGSVGSRYATSGTTTTSSTGSGGAHNNLQPYIVVYFWKRTA